jgi:uncharacterized protein (DUF4415 family)
MISDEPDEDADALDDDTLLEAYAGIDSPAPQSGSDAVPKVVDWPSSHRTRDAASCIEAETLAWFRANRTDWRSELNLVLRGWIAGLASPSPAPPPGD